ncbi:MAG TPA: hypothetical protein VHL10_03205 [Nitrososphaera sp.]|nr:hypothetical protein [Nitrososphaera sp.]
MSPLTVWRRFDFWLKSKRSRYKAPTMGLAMIEVIEDGDVLPTAFRVDDKGNVVATRYEFDSKYEAIGG